MRSCLSQLILVSLLTSCGGSSGGGGGNPPANDGKSNNSEIPSGEKEVFTFDGKSTFAKANIACNQSGYGYALDESLNRMAVCCIALSPDGVSQNSSRFVNKSSDRITIKPEKCDAAIIAGDTGDVSLPVDIEATSLRYMKLSAATAGVKGQLTIAGSKDLDTKLVGTGVQTFFGKTKLSNIHSVGESILYKIRDISDFNELNLKDVKIDSDDTIKAQLGLSSGNATSVGIAGTKMIFDHVTITADQSNPVLLDGFPFPTSGIEILPGKKYAPHIGFKGDYYDNTGLISETRYPIVPTVNLKENSVLRVGPGVMLKLPEDKGVYGISGYNFTLSLEGTADKHITVTSYKDDSVGGDTNGDGNVSAPKRVYFAGWSSGTVEFASGINIHYADLKGVGIFAARRTPINIGNVTIKPSDSGDDFNNSIGLYRGSGGEQYPTLTFDGPVEAWHKIETFNDSGNTRATSVVYASHWSSWATEGGQVNGLNLLTVHNTSTSPQKIDADLRVIGENKGNCNKVQDSSGQVTAEMKSYTYYYEDSAFKKCE